MENKSWNVVLNIVLDIKNKYIEKFGDISYNKQGSDTCIECWIRQLDDNYYKEMFAPVQFSQNGNMVLIRYGNYATIFDGEDELAFENFWYKYNGFYTECRSVVIDVEKEMIVLSPFKKFKNLNEGKENQLDNILIEIQNANTVEITNKLDGSMQSAKYVEEYQDIIMSGSKSINPSESWRLKDGRKKLLSNNNYIKLLKENSQYTFIFEYISLEDSHVVKYSKEQEGLYLIGIRNSNTGEQLSYKDTIDIAHKYNVLATEIFDKTLDDVLNDCETVTSDKMEGFVINIDGHLLKVKTDDYVNIHRVLSKISSPNLIIEYIANNQYDDLISKVPTLYHDRVNGVANEVWEYISKYASAIDKYLEVCKSSSIDIKSFMLKAQKDVPKELSGYVINSYLGRKNDFLLNNGGHCINYTEMKRRLEWIRNQNYS